jgi:hypothetical protein
MIGYLLLAIGVLIVLYLWGSAIWHDWQDR